MQLEGKIALVTGASRGIGKAIAVALAAAGADVAVNYAGNKAAAEAVAAEIEAMGRKVLLLQGDVAQLEVCTEMIDAVIKEFGRIDILVNNAGITRDNLLMRMKEEDWDAVLNTNLKGVFNCTKAAVKYMMKQRAGRIVNITSVVGVMGNAGQANYAAAKAGCIGFTKSVAKEVAARGITVNGVAPGFIKTDMTSVLPEKVVADMEAGIPLARLGEPEDIAKAVLFLVSDEQGPRRARWLAGRVLLSHTLSPLPEIVYGEQGKPAFSPETSLWFNLSHSGDDIALLLSDEGEVGCDLEIIRPRANWRSLANAVFSLGEHAEVEAEHPDRQLAAFWRIWTQKEAIVKQRGGSAWQIVSVDSTFDSGLSLSHCQLDNLSLAVCTPTPFTLTADAVQWLETV